MHLGKGLHVCVWGQGEAACCPAQLPAWGTPHRTNAHRSSPALCAPTPGSKRGSGGKDGKRRKVTPRAGKAEAAVPVLDLDMKLSGYDGEEGDTDMVSQTGPHSEQSCSVTLTMPLSAPKLLMLELVERIAAATPVR